MSRGLEGEGPFRGRLRTLQAIVLLVVARVLLQWIPFRFFSPLLGMHMLESPILAVVGQGRVIADVCRSVDAATALVPWAATCLTRAVAIKLMLERRHCRSTIYLGIAMSNERLLAHAWLRAGDLVVSGAQNAKSFAPVAWFT